MNELDWIVFGILAAFTALILGLVAIWRTYCFRKLEMEPRLVECSSTTIEKGRREFVG